MTGRRRTNLAAMAGAAAEADARPVVGASSLRSAPMKTTLTLDPAVRGRVNTWCTDAAAELEVADVPLASVLRALLDLLLTDETVSTAVKQAVRK